MGNRFDVSDSDGLTLGALKVFIAKCDALDIPDVARIRGVVGPKSLRRGDGKIKKIGVDSDDLPNERVPYATD